MAGIRTFFISALLGTVSMMLGGEILLAVAAGSVALLTAIGYQRTLKDDLGLSTEIALLLTLLLGALAVREPHACCGSRHRPCPFVGRTYPDASFRPARTDRART